ncbi:hypothetical protein [Pseudomonas sp. B16120]|uniref:hypothetical protein n=1 Tax=Pseudomonas sp. B16120 TaxID=3235108 RepID=UPI0037844E02
MSQFTFEQFKELYEGKFEITDTDYLLVQLAEKYHRVTEAYDRTVCTGPIVHGSIVPVSQFEREKVNRYASGVFESIALEFPQFSRSELRRAISAADR